MSSIVARGALRTASRGLYRTSRAPLCASSSSSTFSSSVNTFAKSSAASTQSRFAGVRHFSATMSPHSDAPPSGPKPEYDPEIKDMASYIHNYKIESELAVCEDHLSSSRRPGRVFNCS
jgi:2-methylcitrate dehydratase